MIVVRAITDDCLLIVWNTLFSLFQFLPKCQALNRKSFEIRIQKYLFWTIFGPVSKVTNWKRIWESPLLLCIFICWERVSQKSRNCTSACYIVWIAYSSLFWQGKRFYLFQCSRFCWVTETTRILRFGFTVDWFLGKWVLFTAAQSWDTLGWLKVF